MPTTLVLPHPILPRHGHHRWPSLPFPILDGGGRDGSGSEGWYGRARDGQVGLCSRVASLFELGRVQPRGGGTARGGGAGWLPSAMRWPSNCPFRIAIPEGSQLPIPYRHPWMGGYVPIQPTDPSHPPHQRWGNDGMGSGRTPSHPIKDGGGMMGGNDGRGDPIAPPQRWGE